MAKLGANDLRKRVKLLIEGQPHVILESDFVKPGKGQAFTRVRVRNYINGKIFERTYKSTDTAESCEVISKKVTYQYNDGSTWFFMDMGSFETIEVSKETMGDVAQWLQDGNECDVTIWEGQVLEVVPPIFLIYTVVEAPPAERGDTSGRVMRAAKIDTGATVQIPLFVEVGEKIKVDTRTGEYVERAKS
jgi:elongation factor P